MEKLPRDIIEKISNEFTPEELIIFCNSEMDSNVKKMCDSNDFWYRRLKKDFNFLLEYFLKTGNENKKYKSIYLGFFSKISGASERLANEVFNSFGEVRKYLSVEYTKDLYNFFFRYLLKFVDDLLSDYINLGEEINKNSVINYFYETDYLDFDLPSLMSDQEFWAKRILSEVKTFMKDLSNFLGLKNYSSSPPLLPPSTFYDRKSERYSI